MRLYHGSNTRIAEVDLSHSRSHKDFGAGFYLTPDYARAVRMALRCVDLTRQGTPEVNSYIFNRRLCADEIRIKEFKSNNWEWAEFVMKNRDKSSESLYSHDYEIVIGPVADSSVDPIIAEYRDEYGEDYLEAANLRILASRLKYTGIPYIQYCFCTARALNYLIADI